MVFLFVELTNVFAKKVDDILAFYWKIRKWEQNKINKLNL